MDDLEADLQVKSVNYMNPTPFLHRGHGKNEKLYAKILP